ncbi:MAG: glycosyltransferase family protein [Kofleriaceae bacterium]
MTRRIAIVQARVGSGRLPAKVLADLGGTTMLGHVLRRLQQARSLDAVVVAAPWGPADDVLGPVCAQHQVELVRGPGDDVLGRYLLAARAAHADVIVRVTADCPLLDPEVVERVVAALTDDVDYASNTHRRTFPRGLDVEALHRDTLERVGRLATTAAHREHVTALLLDEPALFRIAQVVAPISADDLRWTVDTPEDLAVVRRLIAELDLGRRVPPYAEVVGHVRANPGLAAGNAAIVQKPWSQADVG